MKRLVRLWPALEELPGLAAVEAWWREALADEYETGCPYFRPAPALAASYPRLGPGWQGPPCRVVQHGPDDFVAVCPDGGEPLCLTRRDVVVHEFDLQALSCHVATALGLDAHLDESDCPASGALRVANFSPVAGYSFSVYLTVPLEARAMLATARALVAEGERPFLLLAPTARRMFAQARDALGRLGACFLALADAAAVREDGCWVMTEEGRRALRAFAEAHVPAAGATDGMVFFPTPAGATWQDVAVRFLDGDTVSISVGPERRALTYSQMGMADARSARPTKQWELLRAFAAKGGWLTWESRASSRHNQKRKENLAKDLQRFFRLEGEPILLLDDQQGWRTVFQLYPDS